MQLALTILRIYKRWISPAIPSACRFYPTCSIMLMEAIERHGVLRGVGMGFAVKLCAAIHFIRRGSTRSGKYGKKELSMEMRLLMFFVLMGLILFLPPYFYKTPTPAQPPPKGEPPAGKTSSAIPVPAATPAVPTPAAALPGQIEASQEQVFAVDTKLYHVEFSNRGAVVRRWLLKAYKDHAAEAAEAKPVDLVNSLSLTKVPEPFSLAFKGQAPGTDVNTALYRFQQPDPLTVNFEFSDGRIDVRKTFRFKDDSYLVAVSSQATQNGAPLVHALSWRGGFGDATAANSLTNQHALFYDVSNSKLTVKQVKEAGPRMVRYPLPANIPSRAWRTLTSRACSCLKDALSSS